MNWLPIDDASKDGKYCFLATPLDWHTPPKFWTFDIGHYKSYRRPKNGEAGRWLVYGTNRKINPKYYQPITVPTEDKQ